MKKYEDTQEYKIYVRRQEIYQKLCLGKKVDINEFAYWMRLNPTGAEKQMEDILKSFDERFIRQHVFEPYIVDFLCRKYNFVIEVDGPHHIKNIEYDRRRDLFLKKEKHLYIMHFSLEELYTDGFVEFKVGECLNFLKYKISIGELY